MWGLLSRRNSLWTLVLILALAALVNLPTTPARASSKGPDSIGSEPSSEVPSQSQVQPSGETSLAAWPSFAAWRVGYASVQSVADILRKLLGLSESNLQVDPRLNLVIMNAQPDTLAKARALLDVLDVRALQILVEVKIVETKGDLVSKLGLATDGGYGCPSKNRVAISRSCGHR